MHTDTSEGYDDDNYPCDWTVKLTVFFYQKSGMTQNVRGIAKFEGINYCYPGCRQVRIIQIKIQARYVGKILACMQQATAYVQRWLGFSKLN